jgi:hypothetical protein
MKHLLILLCITTLTSCGIKNKLLNSSGGTLGVPKQPTEVTTPVDTNTDVLDDPVIVQQTQPSKQNTKTKPITRTEIQTNASNESFVNWYYVLPFVGLAILGLLVYRLKQQNLKSL